MTLTRDELHGGCVEITSAIDLDIKIGAGRRLQVINFTTAGRTATLPPVDDITVPFGMSVLWILNLGANSFTLVDQEGRVNITIANAQAAFLHTIDNLLGNRQFFADRGSALT